LLRARATKAPVALLPAPAATQALVPPSPAPPALPGARHRAARSTAARRPPRLAIRLLRARATKAPVALLPAPAATQALVPPSPAPPVLPGARHRAAHWTATLPARLATPLLRAPTPRVPRALLLVLQAIKALAPRLRAARTLRGPPRLVAASVTAMSEDLLLTPPLRIPQVAVGMLLPQFVPVTA